MKSNFRMQRSTKIAMVLAAGFALVLLASIVFSVVNLVQYWPGYSSQPATVPLVISSLAGTVGSVVMLFLVLRLMAGMRASHSPFGVANTGVLKSIAITLGAMGILQLATELASSFIWYPVVQDGVEMQARMIHFTNATPLMLVLALVVYCVALAFQHGTSLQQQSDETL